MHPPVLAREVGITVHVLGKDGRAADMRRQQSATELVRVEELRELGNMQGSMVFNVDLPAWDGTPRGNGGIDPEFLGHTGGIRNRRQTGIPRGFSFTGSGPSNPYPYARSDGRLQEAAAICVVRHEVHSCGQV